MGPQKGTWLPGPLPNCLEAPGPPPPPTLPRGALPEPPTRGAQWGPYWVDTGCWLRVLGREGAVRMSESRTQWAVWPVTPGWPSQEEQSTNPIQSNPDPPPTTPPPPPPSHAQGNRGAVTLLWCGSRNGSDHREQTRKEGSGSEAGSSYFKLPSIRCRGGGGVIALGCVTMPARLPVDRCDL